MTVGSYWTRGTGLRVLVVVSKSSTVNTLHPPNNSVAARRAALEVSQEYLL